MAKVAEIFSDTAPGMAGRTGAVIIPAAGVNGFTKQPAFGGVGVTPPFSFGAWTVLTCT
jgi:hypothetical protein